MKWNFISFLKKCIYDNYCVFDKYLNFEVVMVLRSQMWFMGSTIFLDVFIFHFRYYSIDLIEIITMRRLEEVITVISVGEI